MNLATPERSWASASFAAMYARGVQNYVRALWRMTFLEGSLAAGAVVTFPVFKFPRPVHLVRMWAGTLGATPDELAALEFSISEIADQPITGQIVTDGRFSSSAPVLAAAGPQFGWIEWDRQQVMNTQWVWTLTNTSAAPIFPVFLLDVEPTT